ncbi:uncharacterized protein MONOS_9463 [Monocercomonoides exilis]|uniref:uncharacterized protein n=1 Tax=Monocercomonoides exilis TaxID=2049356 RepID=UPI00355A38F2|nr:hypothetical protein MONOS_9463 [Monocercomonoides exilis]|eukprot:MONOS_9463.1-p1 / transcript=MONOS_9463.1 / gene=MONOS_9463 / organism=Monocercomonoides_exilis_PA203 / gene_product=unspecified product / transcript_product=unspecified product / location=Mono_scaffold00392:6170-7094(+) / protein_length=259 / sequence_SO=supercontig / SO=protein_coding / is_pseudo=false
MNEVTKQNYSLVEHIVTKRTALLSYIRRAHSNQGITWQNHIRLSPEELKASLSLPKITQLSKDWFYLGYSLAPLLDISSGQQFLKSLSQFVFEYSYHTSNFAKQGLHALMAKEKKEVETVPTTGIDIYKPTLYRTTYGIYFEFLQTPPIPDYLDYQRIVCSLCTIMEQVYKKFLNETWFRSSSAPESSAFVEALKTVDAEFKHKFFGFLNKEITSLAVAQIKQSTASFSTYISSLDVSLPPLYPESSTIPSTPNFSSS